MPAITKQELVAQLEAMKDLVADLEAESFDNDIIHRKTVYMQRFAAAGFATITAIQSVFSALNKPSPFSGAFAWMLFGYAILFLFGYLAQLAMHKNKKVRMLADFAANKARIDAMIDSTKNA